MEITEAIFQRRTIKDFKPDVVSPVILERVLTAGLWAQNHRLTQPWRFTFVGPMTRTQLADAFAQMQATASAGPNEDALLRDQILAKARNKILSKPCVVAVSQRLGVPSQNREDYAAIACAIQNIQLVAWAEGVGMQWSSGKIIEMPLTYKLLEIDPTEEELVGLLFFGYPSNVPAAQPRKPLAEVSRRLP